MRPLEHEKGGAAADSRFVRCPIVRRTPGEPAPHAFPKAFETLAAQACRLSDRQTGD
ncbi:hypothetical protein C7S16_4562 [Burkholderia thailandensis]|uniref:Uncharacterized protein n=1 Tax=Burkholderia thailandensis TaxID=57975 RepID=A0AAW9CP02_BURTH|nr:hypothetical protein [Burkholderia thailandensis]MDW9252593.1 hypothetical protein [Burkholderia thailandensis]